MGLPGYGISSCGVTKPFPSPPPTPSPPLLLALK